MAKIRPLTSDQAKRTFANRMSGVVDRIRQLNTNLGIRPYRVFLVWTVTDGAERGEGTEREYKRVELLPTPKVMGLDSVNNTPYSAGILPVGIVKVTEVSLSYTNDFLSGRIIQGSVDEIPEPYDFFYEIVEDGRGDPDPIRQRFRLMSPPTYMTEDVMWSIGLERASKDRGREGT